MSSDDENDAWQVATTWSAPPRSSTGGVERKRQRADEPPAVAHATKKQFYWVKHGWNICGPSCPIRRHSRDHNDGDAQLSGDEDNNEADEREGGCGILVTGDGSGDEDNDEAEEREGGCGILVTGDGHAPAIPPEYEEIPSDSSGSVLMLSDDDDQEDPA